MSNPKLNHFAAAKFILEANYFPLNDPEPNFREERLVAAEVRVETLAGQGRNAMRRSLLLRTRFLLPLY